MTGIDKANRNIEDLKPVAQLALKLLMQECYKNGINNVFITETFRSQERQNYLYAQGRTRPGNVVTWTKSSIHTSGRAWDIAVGPPNSLYDDKVINKVGAIAGKLGIEWGGTWNPKNIDKPHFQVEENWKIPKGYSLEGEVYIPTTSSEKIRISNAEAPSTPQKAPEKTSFDSLKFTSPTLRNETKTSLESKARLQKIVDAAVKSGASKTWLQKHKDGQMDIADYLGLSVKYIVDNK